MVRPLLAVLAASTLCLASASPATAQADNDPADRPSEPVFTLTNAGDGEKRQLRYHPSEGATRIIETRIITNVTSMMGQMVVPEMYTRARVEVTDVSEQDITMTLEYLRAEARERGGEMPGQVQQMNMALGQLVGSKGRVVVNTRGQVESFELADDAQVSPQILTFLEDAMGQIATPMPEEPVGQGASWTVTRPVTQNDIELTQESTYEITSLSGDDVDISMSMTQSAQPQTVQSQGMQLQLVSMDTSGAGQLDIDLAMMTPNSAEAKMTSTVVMQMAGGAGGGQNIEQTVEMASSITTVEPDETDNETTEDAE